MEKEVQNYWLETKFSDHSLIPDESEEGFEQEVVIEEPTQEPNKSSTEDSNHLWACNISAGWDYLNKR